METVVDPAHKDGQPTHETATCATCATTWAAHSTLEVDADQLRWRVNPGCPTCGELTVVASATGDAQSWMAVDLPPGD